MIYGIKNSFQYHAARKVNVEADIINYYAKKRTSSLAKIKSSIY